MAKGENVRKTKIDKAAQRKDGTVNLFCQIVANGSNSYRLQNSPPPGLGTYERNRFHMNVPEERESRRIGFTYWLALHDLAAEAPQILWFPVEVWYWVIQAFDKKLRAQLKPPFPKAARDAGQEFATVGDTRLFIGGKLVILGWGAEYAKRIHQIAVANLSGLMDKEIHPANQSADPKQVMVDVNRIVEEGKYGGWRYVEGFHTQGALHEWIVNRILELVPQICGEYHFYEDKEGAIWV